MCKVTGVVVVAGEQKSFLDHTVPAPTGRKLPLACTWQIKEGAGNCEVLCLWQAWFEMQVLYNLVDLSLTFLIWVMNQHIRFVMKLKKDNVIHAWPIVDAQ